MTLFKGSLPLWEAGLSAEAKHLFAWWSRLSQVDREGFWPVIDTEGEPKPEADHSVILTTRLLWYFSAHACQYGCLESAALAKKAAKLLRNRFWDHDYGGFFWSLGPDFEPQETHKQAYALAFGIYAFSEYYNLSGDEDDLAFALRLFNLLEHHYRDIEFGGYGEALSREFGPIDDQRLSNKDLNTPKSMNTHLHILEAYTRLHELKPTKSTHEALNHNIDIFLKHIVDPHHGHLRLFFSKDWIDLSHNISFGHDIEASWLLYRSAKILADTDKLCLVEAVSLRLAELVASHGVGGEGGVFYEASLEGVCVDEIGEWWGQAEGLVGFLNAYEISGDPVYLSKARSVWDFIIERHKPEGRGEWTWYPINTERFNPYLAGPWKCPYHNGRAIMEALGCLNRLGKSAERVAVG